MDKAKLVTIGIIAAIIIVGVIQINKLNKKEKELKSQLEKISK
jgi:hypothetical protein